MDKNILICPNCAAKIDVNEALMSQIKKDQERSLAEERQKLWSDVNKIKEDLDKQRLELEKTVQDKAIEFARKKYFAEKQKLEDEFELKNKKLNAELEEKSSKIKELSLATAELEKMKRDFKELEAVKEAEHQKKLSEQIELERLKIQRAEQEKTDLRIAELHKQLEDQKKLTDEMKRKQEQGSQQLQGEVQELAIEEWLKRQFPLDNVLEVPKGVTGADCIQIIHTHTQQNCGKIIYESKRTKAFSEAWLDKLLTDMHEVKADAAVLVTETMPKGHDKAVLLKGIWVCAFEEFKPISIILRDSLIQINNSKLSQENKSDKMALLYDYMTSNEFKSQLQIIVEGFTQMKADLEKEKTAMISHWKKREVQIEKVLKSTAYMYGSIKGIAGKSIEEIPVLELEGIEEEIPENN